MISIDHQASHSIAANSHNRLNNMHPKSSLNPIEESKEDSNTANITPRLANDYKNKLQQNMEPVMT